MDLLFRDTIGIFPNAFNNQLCDKILSMYYDGMQQNQTYEGISGRGINYDVKKSRDWQLLGSGHPDEIQISTEIRQVFLEHVGAKYCGGFPHQDKIDQHYMFCSETFFEVYQVQKYLKGEGHYNAWHNESGSFKMSRRIFAFLVYLNDVREGGETEFLYADLKVKPKKGTLLIHPAGFPYFHKGNVPLSDDKHVLISWLSYVPKD